MNVIPLLKHIVSQPLNKEAKFNALFRFAKWQLNTRLNAYPIIYPVTDHAKLIIQRGMTGATQNLYCGLQDFYDMFFLLHFLRKEDLFLDVGANIGSYTILAAAHVGAETMSFEPVPVTYSHLLNNIFINQVQERVTAFNIGIGSASGHMNFTSSLDTTNHVAKDADTAVIMVRVESLDNVLSEKTPALIKIDVEGFETEVLKGAEKTLANEELKAIIIELNGSGTRYGFNDENIHSALSALGFTPFKYLPYSRRLVRLSGFGEHNTIYVRDYNYVQERLTCADSVKILGRVI